MKPSIIILFLLLLSAIGAEAQVIIPRAKNIAVTPDGISGAQEWDNALKIALEDDHTLQIMADTAWLYMLVSGRQAMPYTDLYVKTANGLINLHASMQLGERLLPGDPSWDDETPAWNWGNNTRWTANTVTYIPGASDTLPFREQVNPYEGQEFRIATSKLGRDFSLMVLVRDFVDAAIRVSYPANGDPYNAGSWQTVSVRD